MDFYDACELFNFENNDYFYHMTGSSVSHYIMEEGLLVDGTNIIDAQNLKDTTTIEITSEMVIISVPKDYKKDIVSVFRQVKNRQYFEGIIDKNNIMGYFNTKLEFTPNPNFMFGNEKFDEALDNDLLIWSLLSFVLFGIIFLCSCISHFSFLLSYFIFFLYVSLRLKNKKHANQQIVTQ